MSSEALLMMLQKKIINRNTDAEMS
jgi:hypothetical protein